MLLFLSLTQFMGAVTILLVKIAFKTYLSSLSLILTMANSKRTVYMCLNGLLDSRVKTSIAGMDVSYPVVSAFWIFL